MNIDQSLIERKAMHKLLEKRRDRANKYLDDLLHLLPSENVKNKKGMRKTDIIEETIKYIQYLQLKKKCTEKRLSSKYFKLGYQECVSETIRSVNHHSDHDRLVNQLQRHFKIIMKDKLSDYYANSDDYSSGSSSNTDNRKFHQKKYSSASSNSSEEVTNTRSNIVNNMKLAFKYTKLPSEVPKASQNQPQSTNNMNLTIYNEYFQNVLPEQAKNDQTMPNRYDQSINKPKMRNNESIHPYKFKNTIADRFSQSKSFESSSITFSSHLYNNDRSFMSSNFIGENTSALTNDRNGYNPSSETNNININMSQNSMYLLKNIPVTCSYVPTNHIEHDRMKQHVPINIGHDRNTFLRVPILGLRSNEMFYVPLNVGFNSFYKTQ